MQTRRRRRQQAICSCSCATSVRGSRVEGCECATAGVNAAGWGRRGLRRPRDHDDLLRMPADDDDNLWALLALALVVATAAGNILVCLAIAWERRLQNVTNYFLMSLAITDLMVAVLVMPLGILTLVKGKLLSPSIPTPFRRISQQSKNHLPT